MSGEGLRADIEELGPHLSGIVGPKRPANSSGGITGTMSRSQCRQTVAPRETGSLQKEQGRVASGVATGAGDVMALAKGGSPPAGGQIVPLRAQAPQRNGNGSAPAGVKNGDGAPAIRLPDLSGRMVSLEDFLGRPTLVVFWNTGCGFCQRMIPDLKAWEAARGPGVPELLLVSSGSADDLRAMGLRSTVLLDPGFTVGPSYGANGTPMGVLVGADGRIASEVAAGADAVLTLAGAPGGPASAAGN